MNSSSMTRMARGVERRKSRSPDPFQRLAQRDSASGMDDHHQARVLAEAMLGDGLDRGAPARPAPRRPRPARRGGRRPPCGCRSRSPRRSPKARGPASGEGAAGGSMALTRSPSTALAVWRPAGARTGHGDLGDRLGLDRDRVEGAVDRRQRVPGVEEGGVYAHREPAVAALGGADQLQAEAKLAGVLEVVGLRGARCPRRAPGRGGQGCRRRGGRGSPSWRRRRGR